MTVPTDASLTLATRLAGIPLAGWLRSPWATWAVSLMCTMVAMPPTGVWGDGEEHYLWLAKAWVGSQDVPPGSALISGMPHAYLFMTLAGHVLTAVGNEAGQALLRGLACVLYAIAFARLAGVLRLGALELALALLCFVALGQAPFAGEWLFRGVEPKVFSYPFLILALADVLERRYLRGFILLAVASHIHLIVGAIWTAIVFIAAVWRERDLKTMVRPALVYAIVVIPLLLIVRHAYFAGDAKQDPSIPDADWIISYVRMPWHAMPWHDRATLREWLPGLLALPAMLLTAWLYAVARPEPDRSVGRLVAVACVYLGIALLVSWFDKGGAFGALTPFRAGSLALLLLLLLPLLALQEATPTLRAILIVPAVALAVSMVVPMTAVNEVVKPIMREARIERDLAPVWRFAREQTAPRAVFLGMPDRDLERPLFSFERRTSRALLVLMKFVPARSADVQEWYRRLLFQRRLFESACAQREGYHVDYLIVPAETAGTLAACGPVVLRSAAYDVIAVSAGH